MPDTKERLALKNQLQLGSSQLLPGADGYLAAFAACPGDPKDDQNLLEPLWVAAELAQRRGKFAVARALLASLEALSPPGEPSGLRRRALERAERLAYLQADLDQAWQLRLRLRDLLAASSHPEWQAASQSEPLRQWRLELGADLAAVQALRSLDLEAMAPAAAVRAVAAVVGDHPQATAAAFVLQQQLRRADQLRSQTPNQSAPSTIPPSTIPPKLWLLRRHPGPSPELDNLESHWRQQHPGWTVEWIDHDHGPFFPSSPSLPRLLRAACSCVNDPAVRGDLLRLAMVWIHGGVAPEWNTRPKQSLLPLLAGQSLLLTQDDELGLNLDLLAATPGHPWVQEALELACRNVLAGPGYSRWDLTGACHLSRVFARWAAGSLSAGELPEGLRLLPLPVLRRSLAFGVPIPRPTALPQEPTPTPPLDQRRRLQARNWLASDT